MNFESINEPIEVITYFHAAGMQPLRFRWRDRVYKIAEVNGVWTDRKGHDRIVHYHVATRESGSFELIYFSNDVQWKVGRVIGWN